MKFATPFCPDCRAPAKVIVEQALIHVPIELSQDTGAEYDYACEAFKFDEEPSTPWIVDGTVTLICSQCSEVWQTALLPDQPTDADTLNAIQSLLSGTTWDSDTLSRVAEQVRLTGREVVDNSVGF